jgi:hypothetical protein
MRISLIRAASGVVAGAAAVLMLAGPASAAQPVRTHTALSIAEWKSVIKDGQKDIVRGTLARGKTGFGKERVILDRFDGKKLVPVQAGLTDKAGKIAFTVRPGVTARYELVFAGTKTLAPSHSGAVTVKVTH